MSNIVKRLRAIADDTAGLTDEAAAEIERLRTEVTEWRQLRNITRAALDLAEAEIERLQGILAFGEAAANAERDGLRAEIERLKNADLPAPQRPRASA